MEIFGFFVFFPDGLPAGGKSLRKSLMKSLRKSTIVPVTGTYRTVCSCSHYQYRNCSTWLAQLNQGRACLARQATVPAPSASTNSLSGQPQSSLPRQAIVPARSASTKSPSGQPRSSLPRPHLCTGSTGWLDVAANDSSND